MSEIARGEILLRATDVKKHFPVRGGLLHRRGERPVVHAVDGVSLEVRRGETLGVVGESGCGKSTLGRCLVRLTDLTSGQVEFAGQDITTLSRRRLRPVRRDVQLVFQDPYASLNPRRRVGDVVAEPLQIHGFGSPAQVTKRVAELFDVVGLSPSHVDRFPHEFSGGQRQRVGIARALAVKPNFLVCDEAVAALDVSIQAQVLNLFIQLREQLHLTYLFISHDLGVVRHLSDRVVIMYLGRVVETAPTDDLFASPNHPYTQGLLAEVPSLTTRKKDFVAIKGEIASPLNPPPGCHFHPRCPHAASVADNRCKIEQPMLREIAVNRYSACHLNQ